jgi:hypothetical protein
MALEIAMSLAGSAIGAGFALKDPLPARDSLPASRKPVFMSGRLSWSILIRYPS